jgi:hypothetical protein
LEARGRPGTDGASPAAIVRTRATVPFMGKNGTVIAAVYKAKTPNIHPNKISG